MLGEWRANLRDWVWVLSAGVDFRRGDRGLEIVGRKWAQSEWFRIAFLFRVKFLKVPASDSYRTQLLPIPLPLDLAKDGLFVDRRVFGSASQLV